MSTKAPATSQGFAEVNGARLWYETAGSGPALVMLHGHLLDSGQWDDQFAVFADEYRVTRYDARGFGRSDKPEAPFSFSEDLAALLGVLGIDRAHLMGCSGGGATIIDLALTHPELASSLVLVGSGMSGLQFPAELPPKLVAFQEAQQRGDVDALIELGLEIWTDGDRRPEDVDAGARERTREMMRRLFARPRVEAEMRLADPPAAGRLSEIHVPVLAIVGADDLPLIRDVATRIEAQVPGARRVVIPDAGHHPNMEHPALFNETVLSFLRAVQAS
jgi:pimeloyl-ACP methyl ester carboxylesterase